MTSRRFMSDPRARARSPRWNGQNCNAGKFLTGNRLPATRSFLDSPQRDFPQVMATYGRSPVLAPQLNRSCRLLQRSEPPTLGDNVHGPPDSTHRLRTPVHRLEAQSAHSSDFVIE